MATAHIASLVRSVEEGDRLRDPRLGRGHPCISISHRTPPETQPDSPRMASKYVFASFCRLFVSFSILRGSKGRPPCQPGTYCLYRCSSSENSRSTVRSTCPVFCMMVVPMRAVAFLRLER